MRCSQIKQSLGAVKTWQRTDLDAVGYSGWKIISQLGVSY